MSDDNAKEIIASLVEAMVGSLERKRALRRLMERMFPEGGEMTNACVLPRYEREKPGGTK